MGVLKKKGVTQILKIDFCPSSFIVYTGLGLFLWQQNATKNSTGKEMQKSTGDLPKKRAEYQLTEGPAGSTKKQPAVSQKHLTPVPPAKKPDSAHFGVGNETNHGFSRLG